MRLGIISDTHMPGTSESLPEKVIKGLEGVDMILHAGDVTEESVLDQLGRIAPVKAVAGNMDSAHLKDRLPVKDVITAGKFKIGLIHGYGPPFGMMDRIRKEFGKVDAIVFGHSHSAVNKKKNGVLFFNPGSPTDNLFAKVKAFGIITIENDRLTGEIIKI
jgi:putative phosphoesterase